MADVQFFETRDLRDVARVREVESVAGVDAQALTLCAPSGKCEALEFTGARDSVRVRVRACVQLDERRAQLRGDVDLR